jgi:hypothetical protein
VYAWYRPTSEILHAQASAIELTKAAQNGNDDRLVTRKGDAPEDVVARSIDNWAVARTKGTMRLVNRGVPGFIVERACFAFRVACCASLLTLPIGLEAAGDKVKDGEARGGGG